MKAVTIRKSDGKPVYHLGDRLLVPLAIAKDGHVWVSFFRNPHPGAAAVRSTEITPDLFELGLHFSAPEACDVVIAALQNARAALNRTCRLCGNFMSAPAFLCSLCEQICSARCAEEGWE